MITKPRQHDIDRAGKRLLRRALESLDWVVNDVQEDYGIDSNVQVFDKQSPTGAWFHVQLKSSTSSEYSSDRSFVSQELPIDHARHYALEMLDPVFLVHADVTSEKIYWCANRGGGGAGRNNRRAGRRRRPANRRRRPIDRRRGVPGRDRGRHPGAGDPKP